MSLPNHYGPNISASHDPRAPSSQRIRADMSAPYPGGLNYLTPSYINNDSRVNKTVGKNTNGSIRTTVETRTRDQNYINVHQLAFLDTKLPSRPVLYSIQFLNWWLATDGYDVVSNPAKLGENVIKNGNKVLNITAAEKAYIMGRFKLYGAVVNRDIDTSFEQKERLPRAFTCTVRGACNLLDYWSHGTEPVRPYDQCYFVLKKVLVKPDTLYQYDLTAISYNTGNKLPKNWPKTGRMCWQIIPYSISDNFIPVKAYSFKENGKEHIGGYWRVGNVHEDADIMNSTLSNKRDEYSISRNISYLHDKGRVIPFQFYLRLDTNCN